jgi:hypothetical protein
MPGLFCNFIQIAIVNSAFVSNKFDSNFRDNSFTAQITKLFLKQPSNTHPEILFLCLTVIIPAAPKETVGEAAIEPGTAAWQPGIS